MHDNSRKTKSNLAMCLECTNITCRCKYFLLICMKKRCRHTSPWNKVSIGSLSQSLHIFQSNKYFFFMSLLNTKACLKPWNWGQILQTSMGREELGKAYSHFPRLNSHMFRVGFMQSQAARPVGRDGWRRQVLLNQLCKSKLLPYYHGRQEEIPNWHPRELTTILTMGFWWCKDYVYYTLFCCWHTK